MRSYKFLVVTSFVIVMALATTPVISFSQETAADRERTLVAGFIGNVISLDPACVSGIQDTQICVQLYDYLTKLATKTLPNGNIVVDTYKVEPRLAESWEVKDDGYTYIFHIRKGVKFPSGNDVDAEAVAYSFNRVLTMKQRALYSFSGGYGVEYFESVKALDKYTVEMRLSNPDPILLRAVSRYATGIVDKSVVDQHGGVVEGELNEWMTTHSAGSGPYILEELIPGDKFVMAANKDYWQGEPYFKKLVFKIIEEPSMRILLLQSGELDFAYDVPYKEAARLQNVPGIKVYLNPGLGVNFIGLNNTIEPFTDPLVRKALCYAVPYDDIMRSVTYGFAERMYSIVPPIMAYHKPVYVAEYDLDKAKTLLAEAGYPDGLAFTMDIQAGIQEFEQIAVIVQQEFSKIGVDVTIRKLDSAKYYEILRAFESQSYITVRYTGINEPGYFLGYIIYSGSVSQYSRYSNPRVDELLKLARSETDEATRRDLFQEIQEIHANDYPGIFLYVQNDVAVMRDDLEGFISNPTRIVEFYTFSRM